MPRIRPHHVAIAGAALTAVALGAHVRAANVPPHCTVNGPLPDRSCTPGALNPSVTQANINATICVQGYTRTIRPPVSYSNPLKTRLMASYGQISPPSA